ncbi:hypothetical protein GWI33_006037 [Rhynchophorus ferrugineus]|uniref:Uncharacterized protein n=1 Tax=Rhynchophorus ferrugineus TaxID=354439 RepID=A0A834MKZ0_RHYFE|nr:hypothetical protein GWI33_006037 [Rhynchophorus ferrugineus]
MKCIVHLFRTLSRHATLYYVAGNRVYGRTPELGAGARSSIGSPVRHQPPELSRSCSVALTPVDRDKSIPKSVIFYQLFEPPCFRLHINRKTPESASV